LLDISAGRGGEGERERERNAKLAAGGKGERVRAGEGGFAVWGLRDFSVSKKLQKGFKVFP